MRPPKYIDTKPRKGCGGISPPKQANDALPKSKAHSGHLNAMSTTKTPKHGGPREGSGRDRDYLKRSKLLAIRLHLVCSESTARRELRDNGGEINGLVSKKHLEVLDDWENTSEFNRGFIYGNLITRVRADEEAGWGVRL